MDNKTPSISEKVKFWEEQDKINNSLIPRFLADHNLLTSVSEEMIKFSSDLAQSSLECLELGKQVAEMNSLLGDLISTHKDQAELRGKNLLLYILMGISVLLSIIAIIVSFVY